MICQTIDCHRSRELRTWILDGHSNKPRMVWLITSVSFICTTLIHPTGLDHSELMDKSQMEDSWLISFNLQVEWTRPHQGPAIGTDPSLKAAFMPRQPHPIPSTASFILLSNMTVLAFTNLLRGLCIQCLHRHYKIGIILSPQRKNSFLSHCGLQ